MCVPGWARAVSLLGVSSLLCLSAFAYDIDAISCAGSASAYIQSAMTDTQAMASAGQSAATAAQNGNSRLLLWKAGSDYQQVANNLGGMLGGVDWSFSAGSSPLIYCNPNGFTSIGNNQWKDSASGLTLRTNKPQLCTGNNLATTYRARRLPANPNGISSMIMLCDVAPGLKGASPDTNGNVAALADIQSQSGTAGFYQGKNMDTIAGYWLTSFSLLHELMHVTQPVPITSGSAEIYGWNRCTGRTGSRTGLPGITTFQAALLNADSYAYWSLSAYVESTSGFDVFDGELFVPPSLPKSRIKRGSYRARRNHNDTFFLWD